MDIRKFAPWNWFKEEERETAREIDRHQIGSLIIG